MRGRTTIAAFWVLCGCSSGSGPSAPVTPVTAESAPSTRDDPGPGRDDPGPARDQPGPGRQNPGGGASSGCLPCGGEYLCQGLGSAQPPSQELATPVGSGACRIRPATSPASPGV